MYNSRLKLCACYILDTKLLSSVTGKIHKIGPEATMCLLKMAVAQIPNGTFGYFWILWDRENEDEA